MDLVSKAQKRSGHTQMYASFDLADTELALSVASLQEVVNYPEKTTNIPLAPPYLTGLFNLRGVVIPIVDVAMLLGLQSTRDSSLKKVAIVSSEKVRVGLLFDGTSEILNVRDEDVSHFDGEPDDKGSVIRSVLRLNGGDRIVEVIDPALLIKVQNIPEILSQSRNQVAEVNQKKSKRCQCITFRSGVMEFGLDISAIREIIRVPEIKRSVLAVDYCIGMVNLRGMIIPILDFQMFLKLEAGNVELEAKRIIIMKVQNIQVGFLVDSVDSIVTFYEEEVLPIPLFQQEKMDMMRGMLPHDKAPNVIFLNEMQMLSDKEILAITKGHATLYGKPEVDHKESQKRASERKPYISFKLDYMLSTRLSGIDEIAKVTEELIHPPGYPEYVVGMTNMRGEMVMVIDLRSYYGMKAGQDYMNSRILVVTGEKGKYGLLVDSVESIVTVDEAQKIKIPMFLAKDVAKSLQGDMTEVVEMTELNGNKKTFMILEVPALVRKLEAAA